MRRLACASAALVGGCALGVGTDSGSGGTGLGPTSGQSSDDAGEQPGPPSGDGTIGVDTETTPCTEPSTWWLDADDDGFGDPAEPFSACVAPLGHASNDADCDDTDPATHPGAFEPCGAGDRDCDGTPATECSSCAAHLQANPLAEDGIHLVDPDGAASRLSATPVWCDMTTDGGGWTLLQRTVWAASETDPLRSGFAVWRNTTLGSAEPGHAYRMAGAAWPQLAAGLEHLLRIELRESAGGGSCAPLLYKGTGGVYTVTDSTAYVNGLRADVTFFNNTELTTTDSGPAGPCVTDALSLPWFHGICCVTCPALRGDFWTEPRPMVNYAQTPDLFGNTEASVCNSGAEASMGFVGANLLEYYVR